MKKTVVYLLIATLLFSLTGCIGLSKRHGFGDLVILGDNLTREADPENPEETGAQPVSENATVKIGGETKKLGETFKNLRTGTYQASISDRTEKSNFAATVKVNVIVGKQTVSPKALLKYLQFNALKFTFDPATFGGESIPNADKITQVKMKGSVTHPTWDRLDNLTKNEDGTWSVIVPMVTDESLEFGFVYWLDADGDGKYDGPDDKADEWAGGNPAAGGSNYTVAAAKAAGIVEEVLGMKFIFDPATFGGKSVPNADKITQVKMKGSVTHPTWDRLDNLTKNEDGTWSVIVPMVTDESLEFGFVYWLDADGDGKYDGPDDKADEWAGGNPAAGGSNYTVAAAKAAGIATLDF